MYPLGFLNSSAGFAVWLAVSVAALIVSVRCCTNLYGGSEASAGSSCLLFAVGFAPVLACLMAGQVGILLLLGFMVFLRWETAHPFWAGAALIMPLAKPHLFAPFFAVFVFWALRKKRWKALAGCFASLCVAIVFALAMQARVFTDYKIAMQGESIGKLFIPSLSGTLRALLFPQYIWVQFVPLAAGLIWSVWYFNRVTVWDWRKNGLTVLLVCILVAPYSFFNDEAILLPVLLYAGLTINGRNWSRKGRFAIWFLVAASTLLLMMTIWGVSLGSGLYFWSPLVWGSWYWLATRERWNLASPFIEEQPGRTVRLAV